MIYEAITIHIEGSFWELLGKLVVFLIVAFIVLSIGYMFVLSWAMGGWRPWHFITDRISDKRARREREEARHLREQQSELVAGEDGGTRGTRSP